MINPDYWGKDPRKACTLTLRLKCESMKEANKIRALIIELAFREYNIKPKSYKFGVEK